MCNANGQITFQSKNIKISMVTPILFSYTTRQLNGDLLYGLLSVNGEVLSEARFVDFQTFSHGNQFYVKAYLKNGLQALFDNEGKMIVDALYQVIEPSTLPNYFKITQDLYSGIIGKKDSMYLMYLQPLFNDVRILIGRNLDNEPSDTFFIAREGQTTEVFLNNMTTLYRGQNNIIDIVSTPDEYRIVIEKDFYYGVIDEKGNTIIEPKYNEVYAVVGQWLLVRLKNEWGAVNILTKQEITPDFERVKISDNKSYGVFVGNKKKSIMVKPDGNIVEFPPCNDVLALNNYIEYKVKKKKERLYLNGQKIPAQFLVIGSSRESVIPVEKKGGWTYVDDKTYESRTDKHFAFATAFFDGNAIVVNGLRLVVIDKNFNEVTTILESKDNIASLLSPTASVIMLSYYAKKNYVIVRNSGKQGILGIKR
jgi:hypothetical protein